MQRRKIIALPTYFHKQKDSIKARYKHTSYVDFNIERMRNTVDA